MHPPPAERSLTPRVVRPSLAILGGLMGALLGSVVTRALMARALAPDDLGLLLFAIACASATGGVASLGLSAAGGRRIASLRAQGDGDGARRAARTAATLAVGCGALAATGLLLAAPHLARLLRPTGEDTAALATALGTVAPLALALPMGLAAVGISRGFGRTAGRSLIRDAGGGMLRAAAIGTALALGLGLWGVGVCFAIAVIAAEGLFLAWCAGQGWLRARSGGAAGRDRTLLTGLRPFAQLELFNQGGQWMDLLVLGAVAPAGAVGYFGVARSLHRGLQMALRAPAHAFLPSATEAADRGDRDLFARIYRRSRLVGLTLLWPPLAIALLVPELPVLILAGGDYLSAAPVLRVLALVAVVEGAVAFFDLSLVAHGRETLVARIQTLCLLLGLLLLVVLVPELGAVGAALALLATELARAAGLTLLVLREVRVRRLTDHFPVQLPGALALTGLAAGALVLAGPEASLELRTAIAVAGSSAATLVLGTGLLRKP